LDLPFSDDGNYLYASGGNDNIIIRYAILNNKLSVYDTIRIEKPWPGKDFYLQGSLLTTAKKQLYVLQRKIKSLYVVNTRLKKVVFSIFRGGRA